MSTLMNAGTAVGTPHLVFQATDVVDFEPFADGNRFIAQLEERSTEPPVHLLINWTRLLEQ